MAKINILDSSIYNLIAAGEVVERPASVIKELVENSIDAGAKNITVSIKDGGVSFMQVVYYGGGIEEDDVKSAFLPHATSKIKEASDLDSIFTLGFRGEALASIASVSKVCLQSKTKNSELGTSIEVNGGNFGEIKKVACKEGTTITVQDLFYCVPARAKFLKKNKSEEQEITNIIIRTILAHPNINITYFVDGKKNCSSLGSTEKEALFSVYGKEAVDETLPVFAERENVKVSGFVGKPTFSKSNRTYQTLIINGRYVINLTVQTAVSNAYGDYLMKRQYPFFVLYLTLPATEIDVNVHPNKLDVKFLKTSLIYSVVFEAVSKALNNMDYVKQIEVQTEDKVLSFASSVNTNKGQNTKIDKAGVNLNPFSSDFTNLNEDEKNKISNVVLDRIIENTESENLRDNFGLGSKLLERINAKIAQKDASAFSSSDYINEDDESNNSEAQTNLADSHLNENQTKQASKCLEERNVNYSSELALKQAVKQKTIQEDFAEDEIKILGKAFNTYLMIEWGNNLYLIDQHAAHERLRYEKLKAEHESGNIVVQPMLVPYVISLNPEDDQIINANLETIRSVGFDIDEFGDRTYKISAIPAIVSDMDFNKFFGMFLEEKLNKNKISEAELVKDSLMQMACKSAIKGGDDLTKSEVNNLLKEMGNNNIILFCPHGRPVVVRITKNEIEKWFKRIV